MNVAMRGLLGVILGLMMSAFSGPLWASDKEGAPDLVLIVPDFPPFTFISEESFGGEGIEIVEALLQQAGLSYRFLSAPNYGRALAEMKLGRVDGFFPATRNEQRDEVATFFELPLANRWCWFFPAGIKVNPEDEAFRTTAVIGTLVNTNTHQWLRELNYRIAAAHTPEALMSLFFSYQRLDAVLVAELVFEEAASQADISPSAYHCVEHSLSNMGLYLSTKFTEAHPEKVRRLQDVLIMQRIRRQLQILFLPIFGRQ